MMQQSAMIKRWCGAGIVALILQIGLCIPAIAGEGLSLDRTRVVFHQSNPAESVALRNGGQKIYLVKSMISRDIAGHVPAPFWITPPLFRLEPFSQNTLRIMRQGGGLAADRESLFYFSALAIPASAKPTASEQEVSNVGASLSFGVRTVIKMFYRPAGLAIQPEQAYQKLAFSAQNGKVLARNNSPYYLSLASLTLGTTPVDLNEAPSLIAPFSSVEFDSPPVTTVSWQLITDHGSVTPIQTLHSL